MKTKHVLMTTALLSLFAACTNDDFISNEQGVQNGDAAFRPQVDVTLNIVNEGNAEWLQFSVDLDVPEDADYVSLQFKGFSSLPSEYVPIDNIEVTGTYTGVKDLNTVTGMVYGQEGSILFTDLQGKAVEVYNVSGVCIDRFTATDRDLRTYQPGVYVVSYNGTASKVMVR